MTTSSGFSTQRMPGIHFPLLVTPAAEDAGDLVALAGRHRDIIDAWLLENGAVLFRGFNISSAEHFGEVVDAMTVERLDYTYRSTPRTSLGSRIFTTTVYPPRLEIPLHQENAYQRDWPMRVAFSCRVAAESGGETPLSDMRRVTARLDPALLDAFEARGVKYVRHYHPGVDLSWQEVFQTDDKDELARRCSAQGIEHEWLGPDLLRTEQVCQGTARHPVSGERLFFNQAHLFHVSSHGPDIAEAIIGTFGADRLPRDARYGDGGVIAPEDLAAVRRAFEAEKVVFPWRNGDVVLLDNMLVGHGRRPFTGKREVMAVLADPHSRWHARGQPRVA